MEENTPQAKMTTQMKENRNSALGMDERTIRELAAHDAWVRECEREKALSRMKDKEQRKASRKPK